MQLEKIRQVPQSQIINPVFSYFELNFDTWRQFGRVIDMSDILLLILDVRYAFMCIYSKRISNTFFSILLFSILKQSFKSNYLVRFASATFPPAVYHHVVGKYFSSTCATLTNPINILLNLTSFYNVRRALGNT